MLQVGFPKTIIGVRVLSTAPPSEQGTASPVQTALFSIRDIAYLIVWVAFVVSPWLTDLQTVTVLSACGLLVVCGIAAGLLARRMQPNRVVLPISKQVESNNSNSAQRKRVPPRLSTGELTQLREWIDDVGWGAVRRRKAMLLTIGVFHKQQSMVAAYSSEAMMQRTAPERVMYEIGSVTKVFTTALLAEMVDRGEVDLHEPISSILPRARADRLPNITLYQLATHTAGLPRFDMGYLLRSQWVWRTGATESALAGWCRKKGLYGITG
jgi:hypothetical protein